MAPFSQLVRSRFQAWTSHQVGGTFSTRRRTVHQKFLICVCVKTDMEVKQRRGHIKEQRQQEEKEEKIHASSGSWGLLFLCAVVSVVLTLTVIFALPSHIDAQSYSVQEPPAFEGALAPNNILSKAERLLENKIAGPESLVIDGEHIYTGLANGDVIVIHQGEKRVLTRLGNTPCDSEVTCGRPLGMRMTTDGYLMVLDSYFGLFKVNPATGDSSLLWPIAANVNGLPVAFMNDLVVASDGTVYFTHTSTKWQRKNFLECLIEADNTGRVIKYDPVSNSTTELARGLRFANGIELSRNEDFLVFCELTESRVWKYYLKGSKKGQKEILVDNLPGLPDNIRTSNKGFWIGLAGVRKKDQFNFLDFCSTRPWIRNLVMKLLPADLILSLVPKYGLAIEIDETGKILQSIHDPTGQRIHAVSEVAVHDGLMYMGSFNAPYLSRIYIKDLRKT